MSSSTTEALAINGGAKTRTAPWPKRRLFGEEEKQAAIELFDRCIASGEAFGYGGAEEDAYCREFVQFMGGEGYADMVNSGTTAVYVALRSLDLPPFTEVIVPPITDAGGCMPVALLNCIPVIADAAPGSYNVAVKQIEARLTERTSAIVVAPICGCPVDMDPIMELARSRGIPVVEDCAQSHGAVYKGRKVGSIGDVAAFSTMFGKHHATGGQGGVVFTRDVNRYWNVRRAADRGKPFGIEGASGNVLASLNFNQDEMGAAIGRAQLKKLPGIIERRRRFALGLAKAAAHLKSVEIETDPAYGQNVFWFQFIKLHLDRLSVDRSAFCKALSAEGIPVTDGYWAVPAEMPWFKSRTVFSHSGFPWASPQYKGDPNQSFDLPNLKVTDACHLRLVLHENCGEQEVADIVAALEKVENALLK